MITHTVMPMGSHTNKPVMKYCLKLRWIMRANRWGLSATQWQAQDVAQALLLVEAAELVSPPTAGAGLATASVAAAAGAAAADAPDPLKSVAYQPVPLS
jgi:hypothetical protein